MKSTAGNKSITLTEHIFSIFGIAAFGIGGLFLFWLAYHFADDAIQFLPTAQSATGRVVQFKIEPHTDSRGRTTYYYYPTIEFATQEGKTFAFLSTSSIDEEKYPVGENIRILYNRSNPNDARIDSFDTLWGTPILLGIIGFICIVGSALLYSGFYGNRHRMRQMNEN